MAGNPFLDSAPAPPPQAGPAPGRNPFLDGPGAAAAPPHNDDPLRGAKAVFGGAARVAGQALSPALDLLSRPGNATQATIARPDDDWGSAGRTFWNALTRGVSPEDQQRNLDAVKDRLGVRGAIDRLPAGLPRGIADAAVGTLADPLTALGGSGALERGGGLLARKALVGAIRTADRAAPGASRKVLRGVMRYVTPGGKNVGAAKYDLIASRGERGLEMFREGRALAKAGHNTAQGIANTALGRLTSATKGLARDEEHAVYKAVDTNTIAKLPPALQPRAEAVRDTFRALAHLEGSTSTRALLADRGFVLPQEFARFDTSVRGILKRPKVRGGGYSYLPHGSQFTKADKLRLGLIDEDPVAEQPFTRAEGPHEGGGRSAADASDPGLHERQLGSQLQGPERQREINALRAQQMADAIAGKDVARAAARRFTPGRDIMRKVVVGPQERADVQDIYRQAVAGLDPAARRAVNAILQRTPAHALGPDVLARAGEPGIQARARSVLDAMAHNQGEQTLVATGRKAYRYADLPAEMKRLFTADKSSPDTWWKQGLRGGTSATKYAFFFNPVRHMLNISMLATLADPYSAAKAATRYGMSGAWLPDSMQTVIGSAKIGPAFSPRQWAQQLPVIRDAARSQARAIDAAIKAGAIDVNPERDIPWLIDHTPVLRDAYRWSGDVLWSFDDAQKATRFDALTRRGMSAHEAAARVGSELIDYGDKSELTRKLAYIAPFATYRSKLPGAVLRSIARHPERPLFINRATPALAGGNAQVGDTEQARSGLPLAEVLDLEPRRYARSTLGPLARMGATAALEGVGVKGADYFTYGAPGADVRAGMNPNMAWAKLAVNQYLSSVPGADQVLDLLHINEFDARSFADEQAGGTFGAYVSERR